MTATPKGSSAGARLVDYWMTKEKEKKFVVIPDKRYARHARFFNGTLIPECGGDEQLAMRIVDMFFDGTNAATRGWNIGCFQVVYRMMLFNERQRAEWVERAKAFAAASAVERDERQGALPPVETPAAATVRWLAKAKEANLKEKA